MINNYYQEKQSSCYFLDLRNSTLVIRKLSLKIDEKDQRSTERLMQHAQFMLDLHKELEIKSDNMKADKGKYFFNDTGDGHMCLFWDKAHAWRALDLACHIYIYLYHDKKLEEHNEWIRRELPGLGLNLNFGIGLHTGGSIVYEKKAFGRDYAFGIAINSAARMESFTKNFKELILLFSGNFHTFLLKNQIKDINIKTAKKFEDIKAQFIKISKCEADIKD